MISLWKKMASNNWAFLKKLDSEKIMLIDFKNRLHLLKETIIEGATEF